MFEHNVNSFSTGVSRTFSLVRHYTKFNNFEVQPFLLLLFLYLNNNMKLERLADSREESYNVAGNTACWQNYR